MKLRRQKFSPGLTLIELLLVIAIIGILAGLLLAPAGRALKTARDADWANKAGPRIEHLITQLKAYYQNNQVTEPLTPDQLADTNLIDGPTRQFLRDSRVTYSPFVSTDPDDMVILLVNLPKSFLGNTAYSQTVRKSRVTED